MSVAHQPARSEAKAEASPEKAASGRRDRTAAPANLLWSALATHVPPAVQAKLEVGAPDDEYERQADHVADQVMRMPEPPRRRRPVKGEKTVQGPSFQRQAEEEEERIQTQPLPDIGGRPLQRQVEEKEEEVQARSLPGTTGARLLRQVDEVEQEETVRTKGFSNRTGDASSDLESAIPSLRGGGQPLPESTRAFFEPRLGNAFSQVRVHTGPRAEETAESINARAFTVGRDVVFGTGQYVPGSYEGRRLLAHELTHVVQQGAGTVVRREDGPASSGAPQRPAGGGSNVLIVGAENEGEFAYARAVASRGNRVTVVSLVETEAARSFGAAGGNFLHRGIETLPRQGQFDVIRENFPYPIVVLPQVEAYAGERVGRLSAGGRWIVATEHEEFARSLNAHLTLRGSSYRMYTTLAAHEASPQSPHVLRGPPPNIHSARPYRFIFIVENTPVVPPTPSSSARGPSGVPPAAAPTSGGTPSTGARVAAGGLGLIMVLNEILTPIGRIMDVQRRNIALGNARLDFWRQFGARPTRGVWDQDRRRPLPPETVPTTAVFFGTTSFPYVVDIDVNAFRAALPALIRTYGDFLLFLDLARSLGTIEVDPPMPGFPTVAERRQERRYRAWVNVPDSSASRFHDVTDVIRSVERQTLGRLDEAMRAELGSLPPAEQGNISRLRAGSETPLFRSARGGQPILSDQQILGPDPWVRPVGRRIAGGAWSWFAHGHYQDRVLVAPANADAARAGQISAYPVKQPIGDTLAEVQRAGRPILQRQETGGVLESFIAGPMPGAGAQVGTTRYYRHPEFPSQWTAAIGELREFWVDADQLQPVAASAVQTYMRGAAATAPPAGGTANAAR